jgi:hypothetical protein
VSYGLQRIAMTLTRMQAIIDTSRCGCALIHRSEARQADDYHSLLYAEKCAS